MADNYHREGIAVTITEIIMREGLFLSVDLPLLVDIITTHCHRHPLQYQEDLIIILSSELGRRSFLLHLHRLRQQIQSTQTHQLEDKQVRLELELLIAEQQMLL